MIKIVSVEEMRAIEAAADAAGVSYAQMMETAGRAVAECVKKILHDYPDPRVAVLVGPGNNGGDGLVAGRILAEETPAIVTFFLAKPRDESDENYAKVQALNLLVTDSAGDSKQGYRVLRTMIANADVVIDALLGTGSKLPIKGDVEKILTNVHKALAEREANRPRHVLQTPTEPLATVHRQTIVVAVDLPTGLEADTGALDKHTLHAQETVTFEAAKPGHITAPGADAVGVLHVAPLNLPETLPPRDDVKRVLVDAVLVRSLLPQRPSTANKGTFGKAMIVGGSANYIGAPALAARAAYRVGAGLVTVGAPEPLVLTLATHILEATWIMLPEELGALVVDAAEIVHDYLQGYTALLLGPGIGTDKATSAFIEALLWGGAKRPVGFVAGTPAAEPHVALPPLVIDADGLNLLAAVDDWHRHLPARTILTPHPGEMARLAKLTTADVQNNRVALAEQSATNWNCVVALKGAYTVIADPDGRVAVMPFANPALARAGTGDVLAGMITGYLAQGLAPFDAAVAGAYVHGYAGQLAAWLMGTKSSVVASDVIDTIDNALSAIEEAE